MPGAADIRDEAGFRQAAASANGALGSEVEALTELAGRILEAHRGLLALRGELESTLPRDSLGDIDAQLGHLVYRGFIEATPDAALHDYPRYLAALGMRLDKLRRGGAGDSRKLAAITPLWQRFAARAADHAGRGRRDPELDRYRWMLEEYRISLFAQELGTAFRISPKRLESQWRKVSL